MAVRPMTTDFGCRGVTHQWLMRAQVSFIYTLWVVKSLVDHTPLAGDATYGPKHT